MATPLRNHGGKSVLALAAGRPGAVPGRRRLIIRPPAPPVNEKTAAGTRAPVGVAQRQAHSGRALLTAARGAPAACMWRVHHQAPAGTPDRVGSPCRRLTRPRRVADEGEVNM